MRRLFCTCAAAIAAVGLLVSGCSSGGSGAGTASASQGPSDEPAKVVVLATGGTIASTHNEEGAVVPTVSGEELVATIRDRIGENVDVTVRQVAELDSSAMTLHDTDTVLSAIQDTFQDESVTGVVVTHGTDSMEESAMAADVFHADPRPVVFTGAMKAFDDPDPDGPGNLADAVNAAVDPQHRGQGAFISFGGDLLPARGAFKQHTSTTDGFASNAPADAQRPRALKYQPLAGTTVWTIASFPGAPRELIDHAVESGAKGIVVEGMGAGNVGTDFAAGIEDAMKKGVKVVMSTRVAQGPVEGVYGGVGGAATLFDAGVLGSGYLRAPQARIALAAALATQTDPAEVLGQQ